MKLKPGLGIFVASGSGQETNWIYSTAYWGLQKSYTQWISIKQFPAFYSQIIFNGAETVLRGCYYQTPIFIRKTKVMYRVVQIK